MLNYKTALMKKLIENYTNCFAYNFDFWYYETAYHKKVHKSAYKKICSKLKSLYKKAIYPKWYIRQRILKKEPKLFEKYNFAFLYDALHRQEDKDFLLSVVCLKILGPKKVRLTDTNVHNEYVEQARKHVDFNDYIEVSPHDSYRLYKTDFSPKNYTFYSTPLGYACIVNEHAYAIPGIFSVQPGDYVLDCGGYVLDSAIPFAEEIGPQGKVFVFEFIPDNIVICRKNLSLNPRLRDRIEIIEAPLSDQAGQLLSFVNDSSCSKKVDAGSVLKKTVENYKTTTIDYFVFENHVKKVDFIKMDIEGSELDALKGAKNTIRTFHPRLAISIYHKLEDLDEIPRLIKTCDDNYIFYLSYSGCCDSEYVLCAEIPN